MSTFSLLLQQAFLELVDLLQKLNLFKGISLSQVLGTLDLFFHFFYLNLEFGRVEVTHLHLFQLLSELNHFLLLVNQIFLDKVQMLC